jgi:hypothetical protein
MAAFLWRAKAEFARTSQVEFEVPIAAAIRSSLSFGLDLGTNAVRKVVSDLKPERPHNR